MANSERQVVVEDLLTKPSAVSPMLFVGLGGCGCKMVARIARHIRRRTDYEERYRSLVKIALVDTNVNDLESYREIADETFLVSDFEKEQYANLAAGKQFLEADEYFTQWVPPNYRFRAGDTAGAGQIRIEARLGVYYQMRHRDFVPRFRKLLEDLKSHEHGHRRLDSSEIRIILCYSVAGGTGSGCHLSLAYMLRDQARELGQPRLIGAAVMPAVFEDKTGVNKDGTFANGYAALKETEHLMKLGAPGSRFFPRDGRIFHYNPADQDHSKIVRERPFEFLFLVDKPESFSVPDPVDAAADGLYLQFFSPLFGAQMSDYDNYTQHQRLLVPNDFEDKGIIGFSTFYGSFGAAVLMVPTPGLVEYCSRAGALSLMRASFLGEIPGDPIYNPLRLSHDLFHEVTLEGEKDERPIAESEFHRKEEAVRNKLRDRLYCKRVRLLAACEMAGGDDGRYAALFRHGHRFGEVPRIRGDFELKDDRIKTDRALVSEAGMRHSIGAIVLRALAGDRPGQEPLLLAKVREAVESADVGAPAGDYTVQELVEQAQFWKDDCRRAGLRILHDGFRDGTVGYPGMDALVDLDFLKRDAGEVDLAAKRYAVLRILEEVDWDVKTPERTEIELSSQKSTDKIKEKNSQLPIDQLVALAQERAFQEVKAEFVHRLGDLRQSLDEFAKVQRFLELGFGDLEREQERLLERLRERGDLTVNQVQPTYVLSAEALQTEDGRRLWDFYYEDKVAGLPELSLSNKRVQEVLSDSVTNLSVARTDRSTTVRLEKLFDSLRRYTGQVFRLKIAGDPYASDPERRAGLTLSHALELEVKYRALYRSHGEEIRRQKRDAKKTIQSILAVYNALPREKQIDFGDPNHRDYLRDKIKRVVKERASLLCVYDESRDQHGGVRPDHVFLAAIDENFQNSNIEEALRGADIPDLNWVSGNWHNEKEIIFYKAVLNVPLYVFGRMDEMRAHYHTFRSGSFRSKTLHIDKNWEDSLEDLDPNSAQEQHRQKLVRGQIINFATLLTIRHPRLERRTCIGRIDGSFYLLDPDLPRGTALRGADDAGTRLLGHTMTKAIERLPEVLEDGSVKYMPYQNMLTMVRDGLSPGVLGRISKLPFLWRRQRDDLREQYGPHRTPNQKETLRDHTNSYEQLQRALASLLKDLRNQQMEGRIYGAGDSFDGHPMESVSADAVDEALEQSVQILNEFSESWKQMEDPQRPRDVPQSFQKLFKPLSEKELRSTIDGITRGTVQAEENGHPVESETDGAARAEVHGGAEVHAGVEVDTGSETAAGAEG
ncbi:MAG: tubulin-like doman-containing protein [Acidobacteriota bacterium]